ncbi:hypothetical protein BH10ACI2_BH10ACI2_16360 [soil metagenome]
MIKRLYPILGTMFAYALLLSVCASLSMAQSGVKDSGLEPDRLTKIMAPGADIEGFRQEYLNYLTELQDDMRIFNAIPAVQRKLNTTGLKPIAMVESAKTLVSEMSQEDLINLRSAYAKIPSWRELPQRLIRPELASDIAGKSARVSILAGTTDDCALAISSNITNTDISIALAASLAAHAAADIVPPVLNAPAVAAYVTTDAVTIGLQTSKAIKDDCRDDSFQDDITPKVTAIPGLISTSTSTTATNITNAQTAIIANSDSNRVLIVNNDNTNKDTIVSNDNSNRVLILNAIEAAKSLIVADAHANKDEVKNLLLRTQIEADLASTDGSVFVALYETPTTVCLTSLNDKGLPQSATLPGALPVPIPQCGLLDLVRAIVRDTIANVGAGTNAQAIFATAEAQRAAGKYKAAYTSYRQAYKAASK